ncbi:hypothetical protein QUF90_03205 [Desulfococcaceae bacterium HSG9]|nr:hypothetical protein [Desulfococcaceae bacterium HSG9]
MKNLTEIVFSGLRQEEDVRVVNCYMCKREDQCNSAIVVNGEPATKKLNLKFISFSKQGTDYKFLICEECLILLSALVNIGEIA